MNSIQPESGFLSVAIPATDEICRGYSDVFTAAGPAGAREGWT